MERGKQREWEGHRSGGRAQYSGGRQVGAPLSENGHALPDSRRGQAEGAAALLLRCSSRPRTAGSIAFYEGNTRRGH